MSFFALVCIGIVGGILSRMCGGGEPKLKYGADQWLFAIPYALVFPLSFSMLFAYFAAFLGKRMGHGQYLTMGGPRTPKENDEWVDFIVEAFFGKDTGYNYWRCVAGLSLTGLFLALLPGLLLLGVWAPGAIIVLASGVLKGPAYMLGHFLNDEYPDKFNSTAASEFINGFICWFAVGIVMIHLI